jgi:hypothetical protein
MNRRRHGSKPTIALWMLVAVADVALLAVAAGPVILLIVVASLVLIVGAVVGCRMLTRRDGAETEVVGRKRA